MSFDNVQALPPGTRLGDYRLDAMIGHGGFGITYRAFDAQLAKVVAIKEYLPLECAIRQADGQVVPRSARLADDFAWGRERFLDEARALARFRHPHIVPVLRYFEANGTAYTVMEFEDGKNVAELLRDLGRRLPTDDVRRLADGLLSGLGAVHAQGFLHRDIKPANIIIRRDGVPILVDFGAARQAMGSRTRSLTGMLTPQYAPIEQYALDGKQGPWSDIYSAAAVLYHAIAGQAPPDAAARVGKDPYRPLAETEGDRFAPAFLAAIDRAMAFAPADRPQSVEAWSALFGAALPKVQDAPTQRLAYGAGVSPPRLGGASRESAESPLAAPPRSRSRRWSSGARVWSVVVIMAALTLWRFQPEIRTLLAGARTESVAPPTPTAQLPAVPPAAQPQAPPPAAPDTSKAIIERAQRAAAEARLVLERADEASRTARSMAGEARIVAARAARPDLERAERLSYDPGASYIGQVADGKRQGLGVADLANGERQAGVWQADQLNGLGTVRLADDTRYAGQWRDGQSTGLGVREKPGVERTEGNFVMGRLEGLGVRRTLAEPNVVQSGEFHGDALEGPGLETVGDREHYEGGFRAGKRNGYGQVTLDGKVQSGRWQDGKPIETAP
ncbi:MAG TPA: protein kinase [Reyranella sp.]|jgi:serine/threonine protein kinase